MAKIDYSSDSCELSINGDVIGRLDSFDMYRGTFDAQMYEGSRNHEGMRLNLSVAIPNGMKLKLMPIDEEVPEIGLLSTVMMYGVKAFMTSMERSGTERTENGMTILPDFICRFTPCSVPKSVHPMCAAMGECYRCWCLSEIVSESQAMGLYDAPPQQAHAGRYFPKEIADAINAGIQVNELASPPAGESPVISPEPAQAHGRSLPNAVMQTTPTNCFSACVATVLGIPITEVPIACDGAWWDWDAFQEWLAGRGLQAIENDIRKRWHTVSSAESCEVHPDRSVAS